MAGTKLKSALKAGKPSNTEKKLSAPKRKAADEQPVSTAKRTRTGGTAKVNLEDVEAASAAATNDKKTPKQAEPQRQAASRSSASNNAAAGDDVEVGSSDSDEASDGGALVEALDFSSEDEADTRSTSMDVVLKTSDDIETIAQAVRARKPSKISAGNGDSAEEGRGVMYVGRLPNGFFEHELRAYFSQFGEVTRLRVSRNRRTGASKGYAFIEFAEAEVCEIAAKTMDHYLLFGHILKCKVIPTESVPEGLWKGANRRFRVVPWAKLEGKQLEQPASEATWNRRISKEERRRSQRAEKLKELGYEYEAPKIKALEDIARIEAFPAPGADVPVQAAVETGDTTEKASEEAGVIAEPVAEEKAVAKSGPGKGKKKAKRTAG